MSTSYGGYWLCSVKGYPPTSTDDLTLDQVAVAEQVAGIPYTMMDPRLSIKTAKALLAVLLLRAGATEDEAVEAAGKMPLRKLVDAFSWEPRTGDDSEPEPVVVGAVPEDPPSSAPTSEPG